MPQVLKDDVRQRIVHAALEVFAEKGYRAATVGAIARRARISTGNVYRYFVDKEALFRAAVPVTFAAEWRSLLRRRVRALDGVEAVADLREDAPFYAASEELLRFSLENRLRLVVLLGRSAGTNFEHAGEALVEELSRLALRHYRALRRSTKPGAAVRYTLDQIYRHWVATMVDILSRCEDETAIRAAVAAYSRYHLAGLNALLLESRQ